MTARHPTRRRLQRWLDTGEPRRVARHIDACAECQEVLEDLSSLDEETVADLQAATTPPADLTDRTRDGVAARLRDEAAVGTFLDLFTIAWDVTRALVDPETTRGETTQGETPHSRDPAADRRRGGTR
jgi:hypothetical protein